MSFLIDVLVERRYFKTIFSKRFFIDTLGESDNIMTIPRVISTRLRTKTIFDYSDYRYPWLIHIHAVAKNLLTTILSEIFFEDEVSLH